MREYKDKTNNIVKDNQPFLGETIHFANPHPRFPCLDNPKC